MRVKDTLITRGLSAGLCILALVLQVIIAGKTGKAEEENPEKQAVYNPDGRIQEGTNEDWYDLSQDNCLSQDIGNGTELLIQSMKEERQEETSGTTETFDIRIYRKGESEPFQELQADYMEQDAEPFVFCDLNADGYLDLLFIEAKSSGHCIHASYLWSNSQQKFVRGPKELDGYNYHAVIIDEDSRRVRVAKTNLDGYENYIYQWSNETDFELVKAFYDTRTESGVTVRIVNFCDGEEQVLMDCEYDTRQFPYYFERYGNIGDIFREFYADNPVWEKKIHVDNPNETYTLLYAQKIQYDGENEEIVTGYAGHLWATDEETRIVKRLFWQSEAPYTKITWEEKGEKQDEPLLSIQYADGSDRTCTLSEILKDPARAVYEKSMQIDFGVKEYTIDTEKYDSMTDKIYKDAYYKAISGQDTVRTREEGEVYLKEYWCYQGDSLMEMEDETFLKNLIDNTQFYYMDFDGDGLPELVMDIIGDGLHILKYLPDEEIVEIFFGYERMPYYNLLGSGQLYYRNPTIANKGIWEYDIVDEDGQDSLVVCFMEDADYKPHKEDEDEWWDMAYWVYLDEELGLVQVDEKCYQEITANFFDAVEHAVPAMTFEEVFGERF